MRATDLLACIAPQTLTSATPAALVQAAAYKPNTQLTKLPLSLIKAGRHADCWHVTGINYGCFLQFYDKFDLGGTPRIVRPLTPTVQSGPWGEI